MVSEKDCLNDYIFLVKDRLLIPPIISFKNVCTCYICGPIRLMLHPAAAGSPRLARPAGNRARPWRSSKPIGRLAPLSNEVHPKTPTVYVRLTFLLQSSFVFSLILFKTSKSKQNFIQ